MGNRLVLVAESSRARLYESEGVGGPLREIEDLTHPEGRLHTRDLISDSPGRSFDSRGEGRHSMEPHTDAKQVEALSFAREIAERLAAIRVRRDVDAIVIAAPPRFLGLLRDVLDDGTRALVTTEIDKNLVTADAEQLASEIASARR
jgi:protein required for attachment to host cells